MPFVKVPFMAMCSFGVLGIKTFVVPLATDPAGVADFWLIGDE